MNSPTVISTRKSSHFNKPSERFNTYTVVEDYGVAQAGKMAAAANAGRNAAKMAILSEGSPRSSNSKLPLGAGRNSQRQQHVSQSRHLTKEKKEQGYARQLKRGEKEIRELQYQLDQVKHKLSSVETDNVQLSDELQSANQVSKL